MKAHNTTWKDSFQFSSLNASRVCVAVKTIGKNGVTTPIILISYLCPFPGRNKITLWS